MTGKAEVLHQTTAHCRVGAMNASPKRLSKQNLSIHLTLDQGNHLLLTRRHPEAPAELATQGCHVGPRDDDLCARGAPSGGIHPSDAR